MNSNHPPVQRRSVRDVCRSLQRSLEQAGRRVTVAKLMSWTRSEREQAEAWAYKSHRVAMAGSEKWPAMPPHVAVLAEVAP